MNCHEFRADLVDLARGAGLPDGHEPRVRRHLGECADCAARFESERSLTIRLKALAGAAPQSPRAAAIGEQLAMEFAARHAATSQPAPAPRSVAAVLAAWPSLAAAAALVIAAAVWAGSEHGRSTEEAQPSSTRAAMAPSRSDQTTAGAVQRQTPVPTQVRPADAGQRAADRQARTTRSGSARPVRASNEEVLRFVVLPTAVGLPGLESGRIVRVEVPAAMLPAYGLDVMPGPVDGVVEADVLVGQDGQARAIRFVSLDSTPRRRQ